MPTIHAPMLLLCVLLSSTSAMASPDPAQISPERIRADLEALVGFGTRHTLSDLNHPTRGIGAAARWALGQFDKAGVDAELETFDLPSSVRVPDGATLINVVGRVPGTRSPERMYYVVAHYDSRALNVMDAVSDAPGANDDGSGTALVLELARLIQASPLESTVVFLLTSGEEQGLLGARFHASQAAGDGLDIRAVLSSDIVGDPTAPPGSERDDERFRVRVFSPGIGPGDSADEIRRIWRMGAENDSPARQLARAIYDSAIKHKTSVRPLLINRTDRFLRGGDHYAFLEAGFPSVRFTEVHENYNRQHQNVSPDAPDIGDTLDDVDPEYIADVARLKLVTLTEMANAPSAPANARLIAAGLTNDTTIRWSPSPEADTAGYEVVWRPTTEHHWTRGVDVGDATEHTIKLSKDNWFFGVRAYDADGNRSPVSFPGVGQE